MIYFILLKLLNTIPILRFFENQVHLDPCFPPLFLAQTPGNASAQR
jgi:hypothetical protein